MDTNAFSGCTLGLQSSALPLGVKARPMKAGRQHDDELARRHMDENVGYRARWVRASHLQQQHLLLGLLQLLLGRVERAVQAASLNRQPHAALFRLQLLTLNLTKRRMQKSPVCGSKIISEYRKTARLLPFQV